MRANWLRAPITSLVLASFCGAILSLIHMPLALPAGFIGIAGAHWLVHISERPKLVGYGLGLGYFIATLSWIREPFALGPPGYEWMAYPVWIMMGAGIALFWLPIFMPFRFGIWAIAAMFLLMERLRGWLFTGFPWAELAHGLVDNSIAQIASIGGTKLLSALILFCIISILGKSSIIMRLCSIMFGTSLVLFGMMRPPPSDLELADYQVTLVQANIPQNERWDPELALAQFEEQLELSKGESDLVIWPESSTRFNPLENTKMLKVMDEALDGRAVLFGAPAIVEGKFYNAAYFSPGGKSPGGAEADPLPYYRYDKRHLVPFGEYIPFGDWLLEHGLFVRTVTLFSARKGEEHEWPDFAAPRPNILICYEGIFSYLGRREGDYLAQITNDSWFGQYAGPQQHLAAARFRAIENGLPMARAAITGISAMIDANGRVTASIPLGEKGAITAPLGPRYEWSFYRSYGELLSNLILLIAGGYGVFIWRRRRRT